MNKFSAFFRQPLNQAALVAVGGTVWAVLQGSMSIYAALPIIGGAVVAWLLPDNSLAKEDVETAIQAGIQAFRDIEGSQAKQTPSNTPPAA